MADPSTAEQAEFIAQINASPAYQAFKAKPHKSAMDFPRLAAAMHAEGFRLPHDWAMGFDPSGAPVVQKKGFFDRNGWAIPALIVGGTLTGGALLAAAGGGAGAAGGLTAGGTLGGADAGVTAAGIGVGGATGGATTAATAAGLGGTTAATTAAGTAPTILSTYEKYKGLAGDAADLTSGVSGGLADGRRADDTASFLAASQNNRALVDAAQFNRDLPVTRAQQVAKGALMAAPKVDAGHTGTGRNISFTGGIQPSMLGPDSLAAGNELKRQALAKLMDPEADKLTPQMATPTRPGTAENVTGIVGTGLNILDMYNKYRKGR